MEARGGLQEADHTKLSKAFVNVIDCLQDLGGNFQAEHVSCILESDVALETGR